MGRRKRRTRRWVEQQSRDPYARAAREQGFRSRAALKLKEIADRDRLFSGCRSVLDLGSSPGGWSQVVAASLGHGATITAVDLLPMDPVPGVRFIRGDFSDIDVQDRILGLPPKGRYDLVISDMSPNITGIESVDQARSCELAAAVARFAPKVLESRGKLLIKVFSGSEVEELRTIVSGIFKECLVRKPKASKTRSREFYLLMKHPLVKEH